MRKNFTFSWLITTSLQVLNGTVSYDEIKVWVDKLIRILDSNHQKEMFGYVTSLRSNTQGRGQFTMVFDHYDEVPRNIAEEIIKKNGGN